MKQLKKKNQIYFQGLVHYNQEVTSGYYNVDTILWIEFISQMAQKYVPQY